jgi:hypothetical protein
VSGVVVLYGARDCDQAGVVQKPRLLSDNGSSYVSADLADWLDDNGMDHLRGAPRHPQTQGTSEGWHQTLKNRILLENYYLPGDLKAHIGNFVEHYNHRRYHESLNNVPPPYATRKDQTRYHPQSTIAAPNESRLNFCSIEPRASARSHRKLSQSIRRRTAASSSWITLVEQKA